MRCVRFKKDVLLQIRHKKYYHLIIKIYICKLYVNSYLQTLILSQLIDDKFIYNMQFFSLENLSNRIYLHLQYISDVEEIEGIEKKMIVIDVMIKFYS